MMRQYDDIDEGDSALVSTTTGRANELNGGRVLRSSFDSHHESYSHNHEMQHGKQDSDEGGAPFNAPDPLYSKIYDVNVQGTSACSSADSFLSTWPSGLPSLDFLNSEEAPYTEWHHTAPAYSEASDSSTDQKPKESSHRRLDEETEASRTDWIGKYRRTMNLNTSVGAGKFDEEPLLLPPSAVFAAAAAAKLGEACDRSEGKEGVNESSNTTPPITGNSDDTLGGHDNTQGGSRGRKVSAGSGRTEFSPSANTVRQRNGGREVGKASALDVVGGRGGEANKHEGNRRYWSKVLSLRARYRATGKDNAEKNAIAKAVLEYIQNGGDGQGRFLTRAQETKCWVVMPDSKALLKIKQALRDFYVPEFARHKYPYQERAGRPHTPRYDV